jgi:hypothetical protein
MVMEVKKIIAQIKAKFAKIPDNQFGSDEKWTREINNIICQIGNDYGYKTCASHSNTSDFGEWMYDIIWIKYKYPKVAKGLLRVPLVAECEWGSKINIFEDFEKLLFCKADLKIFIFQAPNDSKKQTLFDELNKEVTEYENNTIDDRYLLICWVNGERCFKYYVINCE